MKVKRNLFMKMVSAFLAALMIVQILPMTVWGAEVQNSSLPEVINSENDEIHTIQELSSENNGYEKTYLAEDGSKVLLSDLNSSVDNSQASTYSLNQSGDTDGVATLNLTQTDNAQTGSFVLSSNKKNYAILEFNLDKLKNSFVKNAYISLDCVNISGSGKAITVAPLNKKWTSGSNPSIAST